MLGALRKKQLTTSFVEHFKGNHFRSLKNYTQEILLEELRKINFPDYSIFSNDKIAPFKVLRVKNNTQEWFDSEVAEAIDLRDKRLKHFKSTKLHVDEELYKEAKYQAQKLIKVKKKQFYKEKLKENIGKPKDLWKTLKSLGLPSKKGSNISNICLKKDDKKILTRKPMQTLLRNSIVT